MTDYATEVDHYETHIVVKLTHTRELTETEYKNLIGNISDHINGEDRAAISGFDAIESSGVSAKHVACGGGFSEPVYPPVWCSIKPAKAGPPELESDWM
jgi:hypothetical protein